MFKLISYLLIILVYGSCATSDQSHDFTKNQEIQRSNNLMIRNLELALEENRISIDELLNEVTVDNEFSSSGQLSESEQIEFPNILHQEPDYDWNAKQMIEYRGFKFEEHHVVTEDCYILTMHRIVNPLNNTANKPPVLLQHGLFDSSAGWLMNTILGDIKDDDNRNLGFALAKKGYDVWLANTRGNTYSKNHTTFSKKNSTFWKFTFDNIALQDLPAQIAYIQEATDYDQIIYTGHSQGTLIMFELLSFKPEVANSISAFIALAPIAHLGNLASPTRYLAASKTLMKLLLSRNSELLPYSLFSKVLSTLACRAFPGLICKNFLYLVCGFSENQLNSTRMPVYSNHYPSGSSLANLIHYGLNYRSKKVQMLDYMTEKQNIKCYNRSTPPLIPLDKITLDDIYLISSMNDLLASPKDVELLKKDLKDFTLSQRSDYYVNDYIMKILENKRPAQRVGDDKRVRLKKYTAETCTVHDPKTRCHLDVERALRMIVR